MALHTHKTRGIGRSVRRNPKRTIGIQPIAIRPGGRKKRTMLSSEGFVKR